MMVVPVLITSCQVSEKPKSRPERAQTTIVPKAEAKTQARPTSLEVLWARSEKSRLTLRSSVWQSCTANALFEGFLGKLSLAIGLSEWMWRQV